MKPLLWSALILSLAALPLTAQPAPARGRRAERIARALNLTEAQKASLRSIREKHRQELLARRDAVQQAQAALRTALRDAATPDAQLRALNDRASTARFEAMLARRSVRQEVQAVLTPDQRIKAAEWRDAAQERLRERLRHPRMDG